MDRETLSETELDHQLQRGNPVNRAVLDDESILAALAAVRRSVESGADREVPSHLSPWPVYRRRWATLGAATAALAVASLVGVETLTGGAGGAGLPLAVSPAAAAQLGKVAHAAAGQVMPGAGQLQYLEYKLETTADPSFGGVSIDYTYEQTLENWNGPMPALNGRQLMTADGISFATPQDRANYLANKYAFDSEFAHSLGANLGTNDPTATGLLADVVYPPRAAKEDGHFSSQIQKEVDAGTERPNGPQALLADLTAADDADPGDLWGGLLTILRDSTDAQLRATAYEALAYVPGTTVLGNRTDQIGRVGVAIHFTYYANGPSDKLIVSPSTGYMLEDDTSFQTSEGTVVERELDLQRGVVDSITALPGGGSQPITAATRTINLLTGTSTPTLQTTTRAAQSTTSTPQTTTTPAQPTTSTPQTTTTPAQLTISTPQTTTTPSQTTTSTP